MASLDELKRKVDDLLRRHGEVTQKKAELRGQLEAKKAELVSLGNEIKAAGFDPRKLKEQRDQAEQDLETLVRSFEQDLKEVEQALAAFEQE